MGITVMFQYVFSHPHPPRPNVHWEMLRWIGQHLQQCFTLHAGGHMRLVLQENLTHTRDDLGSLSLHWPHSKPTSIQIVSRLAGFGSRKGRLHPKGQQLQRTKESRHTSASLRASVKTKTKSGRSTQQNKTLQHRDTRRRSAVSTVTYIHRRVIHEWALRPPRVVCRPVDTLHQHGSVLGREDGGRVGLQL